MSQELEKLYEELELNEASRLQKIALAAGAGLATLIGLGVKKAVNTAVVAANKKVFQKWAEKFKEELVENIKKRVSAHKESISGETDKRRLSSKKRQFEKVLMDFVKKSIDVKGKEIAEKIDKSQAGKRGKEALKVYWESISSPIELDILQELHRLDIIGEEEMDRRSEESSKEFAEIMKVFLKTFGKDPSESEKSNFQQLKNVFIDIKKSFDNPETKRDIDAIDNLIEKIDQWLEFYEKIMEQLSDEEKRDLQSRVEEAKKMRENLVEIRTDLQDDRDKLDFSEYLTAKFLGFWKKDKKFIKDFKDLTYYLELKDPAKLKRFAKHVVDHIVTNKDEYEDEFKALDRKKLGSREDVLLKFVDPFLYAFNEEEKEMEEKEREKNESFVSFYDYYKNQL